MFVPLQVSLQTGLFDRIAAEARTRGCSEAAIVRRRLAQSYACEDAGSGDATREHPAGRDQTARQVSDPGGPP